jgi:RNA polymerase sigma-70 factor (sigma-E family)
MEVQPMSSTHALVGTGVTTVPDRDTGRDADFAAYMQARQASLLRTAYLLTGDRHTAEDLTQTAFAKLYLAWDKVRDQGSIDGYVRRIVVNEHNSLWRRAWKRRELSSDQLPEDPHHDTYDSGAGRELWELVQTLPRKARAVVVLRYYEEMTEAETAEVLGISVGTVKSQSSRALAALRERAPQTLNPTEHPTGHPAETSGEEDR